MELSRPSEMSRPNCNINSIPPELLGLVITHASLDDPSAPLRLAAVSGTFYRVAMSTPGAWTKLFLRVTSGADSHAMNTKGAIWLAVQKAKMWFQRSGACSVDISVEMEQTLLPSISAPSHGSSINGLDIVCEENDADTREAWGILLLPHVLSRFQHRIRSLKLHTTTPEEAQEFFNAVYPPPPLGSGPHDFPLEGLTVVAAGDGHPQPRTGTHLNRMPMPRVRLPSSVIGNALCRNNFSHLEHLKFVNLPLPLYPASASSPTEDPGPSSPSPSPVPTLPRLLSAETGHRLRSISITYPLRFAPIPLPGLLDALRATSGLEKLTIEGRLSSDSISNHQQGHGATPAQGDGVAASVSASHSDQPPMPLSPSSPTQTPTSMLTTPPYVTPAPTASSTTSLHTQSPIASHTRPRPLLALPGLSFLSLKVNNLPAILSCLVLPALHELRIDDMDSKRRVAAYETAEALRGLIVRADMPLDGLSSAQGAGSNQQRSEKDKAKGGLEVLYLCNIVLRHPRGISTATLGGGVLAPHSGPHTVAHRSPAHSTHSNANEDDSAAALWRWCFRRMIHLRELRVESMDLDALLGYITPPLPTTCSLQGIRSHHSTSGNRFHSKQSEHHRSEVVSYQEAEYTVKKETEMKARIEVELELLPSLKRLTLADYGPMPTWLSSAPGVESSTSPFAGDEWTVSHTFPSASTRVFKSRRPDVVVENASTRSVCATIPVTLHPMFPRANYSHALQTGPVDYLSLYLQ